MKNKLDCDQQEILHLKRELNILKEMDHPNVIKFYEVYQDEFCIHLVMEYCCGGDLDKYLDAHKNLTEV